MKESRPISTQVAADTRINIKLKSGEETEINGLGPTISKDESQQLKDKLSSLTKEDIVIFSGSKPNGLTADYYQELIAIVKEAGAEFVIDTTGPELFAALPDQPLLIKTQQSWISGIVSRRHSTPSKIFYLMDKN